MYHIYVNSIMDIKMTECFDGKWLLLIHQIPPKPAYLRVKIWRRLQGLGAVAIKNTVYVIPKNDETFEDFQWVLREIKEAGGEAAICVAAFVEGLSDEQVAALFRAVRDADYSQFAEDARQLLNSVPDQLKDTERATFEPDLNRLRKRLANIVAIDFFPAPGRSVAEATMLELHSRLGQTRSSKPTQSNGRNLNPSNFKAKTWVTRKGVYIDRIACAWLIRRFIDSDGRFRFVSGKNYRPRPDNVRFDMFEGDFTHEGDLCSFEVLVERFFPKDRALAEIGRIVHDLDLKDGKFRKPETAGVGSLIEGVALTQKADESRLVAGAAIFDQLYAYFNRN
jgi:hypothetical protein